MRTVSGRDTRRVRRRRPIAGAALAAALVALPAAAQTNAETEATPLPDAALTKREIATGAVGRSPYSRSAAQQATSETEQLDRAVAGAQAQGRALQSERTTAANAPSREETRVSPTLGVDRAVGGPRGDTTGQSNFTSAPTGVDIPPGGGGGRSDSSGQPDFTDNDMGVD